ncbi:MAG: ubiquitin [Clostridiales bacterium]|nr:MAG: ubiquitin [Clostridiales bacterium]
MSFTIENVDEVIQRTGATYKEAKEALEAAEGDVLEAIIKVEEGRKKKTGNTAKEKGNEVVDKLKELVKKGNVTRIMLKKEDRLILDIPVTAGAVGAIVFAPATVAAIIVSLATGCKIEIQKESGEIIDVNDVTEEKMEKVIEMAEEFGESAKEKAAEAKEKASEAKEKAVEKAAEVKGKMTKKAEDEKE